MKIFIRLALALVTSLLPTLVFASPPKVVASIAPIQSLVANVMQGVGEPSVLIKGGASPHSYSLKPSDAAALQNADVIFWVGPELEPFLVDPLKTLGANAQIVTLENITGLERLPVRSGGSFEPDAHDSHAEAHGALAGVHEETDPHLWLDPQNAKAMVMAIADALDKADLDNATSYDRNAAETLASLDDLANQIRAMLEPVQGDSYIVFHDAFQYFENRFSMPAAGSITVSPESLPGAKRLAEIRDKIKALGATCVFTEPQFKPQLADVVTEGLNTHTGVLDPLGADIPPGPDLYFTLIRKLAKSLGDCLQPAA